MTGFLSRLRSLRRPPRFWKLGAAALVSDLPSAGLPSILRTVLPPVRPPPVPPDSGKRKTSVAGLLLMFGLLVLLLGGLGLGGFAVYQYFLGQAGS